MIQTTDATKDPDVTHKAHTTVVTDQLVTIMTEIAAAATQDIVVKAEIEITIPMDEQMFTRKIKNPIIDKHTRQT